MRACLGCRQPEVACLLACLLLLPCHAKLGGGGKGAGGGGFVCLAPFRAHRQTLPFLKYDELIEGIDASRQTAPCKRAPTRDDRGREQGGAEKKLTEGPRRLCLGEPGRRELGRDKPGNLGRSQPGRVLLMRWGWDEHFHGSRRYLCKL